jgi:serine phosphatase RsbU (regulator of sigma subunit)
LEAAIVLVYGHVNQLMDAPIFNIGDYMPHEHCIKMRYLIENGEFVPPPTVRMNEETRPAVRCVRQRVPIVMNDVDIPVLVGVKPASLVYVPLISGDRVIGVFSVQSLKPNSYPQENVDLLVAISSYIATAMENGSAFARIKKQQTELEQQAAAIQIKNVTLSEQNIALEKLNTKVIENIAYAETIQRAVLPLESDMSSHLGDHFILYKPMEVISGDFYWLQRTEFATLVAVVDCTGHGVPGAFMSMIGNDLLNQIVLEKDITSPSWILTELHYAVRHALKQSNDMTSNQDGMDVCLCRIEPDGITFAGARRSLYIVQGGEIIEIEGDTKPIGGFQREAKRSFTSKRLDLDLSKPAMLYLTSDGYADQHNLRREKFGTKRLTQLFQTIAGYDVSEQHNALEHALSEHKGSVAQRDDITVMGIRLQA